MKMAEQGRSWSAAYINEEETAADEDEDEDDDDDEDGDEDEDAAELRSSIATKCCRTRKSRSPFAMLLRSSVSVLFFVFPQPSALYLPWLSSPALANMALCGQKDPPLFVNLVLALSSASA
jgi:hypothetical protein